MNKVLHGTVCGYGFSINYTPVVSNGVLFFANVHELGSNSSFLLTLPHQPLHKHLLTPHLLHREKVGEGREGLSPGSNNNS